MHLQILNQFQSQPPTTSEQIALQLKQAINQLKADFYDLETGGVHYAAIKGSSAYQDYLEASAALRQFDLNQLVDQTARLAFWINIYNALTVHGIIELGIQNSVREVSDFFSRVAYHIGGLNFSLDDIEHGILRRNAKKHLLALRPFGSHDPRKHYILSTLDPRIHFCLVCGSKSCPPIGTYQPEKIDEQLTLAAMSFINSDNVILEKESYRLSLSKIFQWYGKDFGQKSDLLHFIAEYRHHPQDKAFILEHRDRMRIRYQDYDWCLNH